MNANVHAHSPRRFRSAAIAPRGRAPGRRVAAEGVGLWLILGASFALFLAVAMVGAVFGVNWRAWLPGAEGSRSLLAGAWSAANSVLPML